MIKKVVCIVVFLAILFGGYHLFKTYQTRYVPKKKFVFWSIQLKPIYEKQIMEIIKKFETKHRDYKVVWVDIPIQEAQKRTLASVLSSNPPDLINLNPDFSQILASRNILHFFNEDELQDYHKGMLDMLRYNEKIYGVPFYATSPITIFNKDIYEKCFQQEEFIKSYGDLYEISEKLYKCSSIPVFTSSLNENDTLSKILNKYDVFDFANEQEKLNTTYVYSMFNDMYKKNYLPKDILSINHREVIERYMSSQTSIVVAGSNFIKMIKQNAPDIYNSSDISSQLIGKNGKYDVSLMNLVIPKKSKNISLAYEFIYDLTSKENQLELAKLTNVLCANKYALQDEYFKKCSSDLVDKSRCISVNQLDKLNISQSEKRDKKTVNELLNKKLEQILLDKNKVNNLEKDIDDLFLNLKLIN